MEPSLAAEPYGVALIGEALGEDEAAAGRPFVGRAGFKLTRLIEWAGLDRDRFDIFNTVWCRPPENRLEGEGYEQGAISHCREKHWGSLLERSRVLVPMGNVATAALLGQKGILTLRGYVEAGPLGTHVVPTVHPSFIQRGQGKWSSPFIADLRKAVELARSGLPPTFLDYSLDPSPLTAYQWARSYREALGSNPLIRLAFDIETPGKGEDEDGLDTSSDLPDQTWKIERIGFAFRPYSGLSIPFSPEYAATINLLLSSEGDKIVWNAGFDVPRLRRAGVKINGTIHDGMVAWHILHSDLPKKLSFVASIVCPYQRRWKHLSGAQPAFYNATDADVELRCMEGIEAELRRTGLWAVYERDVLELEPILAHMSAAGMPVDAAVRQDRAIKLAALQAEVHAEMTKVVPIEARKVEHVYKSTPKQLDGLLSRPGCRDVRVCSVCGVERPRKDHFKRFVKRVNPCSDGSPVVLSRQVEEFYRLAPFTPSRDQLIRYHQFLGRALPMSWDGKAGKQKVSFDEGNLKKLILAFPEDQLYPLILRYRSIDKIAGTYVGRPCE